MRAALAEVLMMLMHFANRSRCICGAAAAAAEDLVKHLFFVPTQVGFSGISVQFPATVSQVQCRHVTGTAGG